MAELPTASEIASIAGLLAPGLIIATIRTRAITGSVPDLKDRIVSYGIISTAYFAAVTPLFHIGGAPPIPFWAASIAQNFLIPIIVGIALAYIHQWAWAYRLADRCGLKLAHHLPAAWDYVFESLLENTFVLVTLNDGTQVAGRMAKDSFAASSNEERDLFVQELWEVGDENSEWKQADPPRGVLLCGKNITSVEFY